MRSRRTVVAAAGVVLASALSGCGTTVPLAAQTPQGTGDLGGPAAGPAQTLGTTVAPGTSSAQRGASVAPPTTGLPGGGGPSSGPVPASPGPGTSSAGSFAASGGPGVTATTISFGYIYAANSAQQQAALGNTVGSSNDPKRLVDAAVAAVNAAGGIAGRKLVPRYTTYDASTTQTADQLAAEFCSHFTTDVKVLTVVGFTTPNLVSCLRKKGVLATSNGISATEKDFAAAPNLFDVAAGSLDQVQRNLVDSLVAQKYFTAWNTASGTAGGVKPVTVGILGPDDPNQPGLKAVVKDVLLPELSRNGITVDPANVVFWDASSNQNAVAGISSAQLRFASNGVTHVLPIDVSSLAFFSTAAESQRYRPRYGITSTDYAAAEAGTLVPTAQLAGALGLGWMPSVDLPQAESTKKQYLGPGAAACLKVMKDANVDTTSVANTAQALGVCDVVTTLRSALALVPQGTAFGISSVMSAVERLGSSVSFAALVSGSYGPGKHFPLQRGWHMAWSTGCTCLTYTSAARTLR